MSALRGTQLNRWGGSEPAAGSSAQDRLQRTDLCARKPPNTARTLRVPGCDRNWSETSAEFMVTLLTRVFYSREQKSSGSFYSPSVRVSSAESVSDGKASAQAQAGEAQIPPSGRQAASREPANCKAGWEKVSPGRRETNNVFYEDFASRSRAQNRRQMPVQSVFDLY